MSLVLAQNGLSYMEPATRKLQATKMEVVRPILKMDYYLNPLWRQKEIRSKMLTEIDTKKL